MAEAKSKEFTIKGGQFDGERQAIQLDADFGNRESVLLRSAELRLDGPGAFEKEAACAIVQQRLCGGRHRLNLR